MIGFETEREKKENRRTYHHEVKEKLPKENGNITGIDRII